MTIQLSVSVWTVICFVLLMLILHNLLFKPVLKVMDERNERISKASQKKFRLQEEERKREVELSEKKAEFISERKKQIKNEIEEIRAKSRQEVVLASKERVSEVDAYHHKADERRAEILSELSSYSNELAVRFADSLLR